MTTPPPRRAATPLPSTGDVLVTPAPHGYDIGAIEGFGFRLLGNRTEWDRALRLAQMHARLRTRRVWLAREDRFEALVFEENRAVAAHLWFRFDTETVLNHVPTRPGIYVLRDGAPVYIGHTDNLRERLRYHLAVPLRCPKAAAPLDFSYEVIEAHADREERSDELIAWWAPPCNQGSPA